MWWTLIDEISPSKSQFWAFFFLISQVPIVNLCISLTVSEVVQSGIAWFESKFKFKCLPGLLFDPMVEYESV